MKTLLKRAIGSLALLVCLSNAAFAAESTPQPVTQPNVEVQQTVVGPLAWQRVGSPRSMEA